MIVRSRLRLVGAALLCVAVAAHADNSAQSLPYSQNWTTTTLITANDDWSGVPGVEGFLGQDITTSTGTDPQTLTGVSAAANDLSVLANQSNPTISNGDVIEFDGIANPTIAVAGSGTADAPYLLLHLDTTGVASVRVSYNLRDLDSSTDNSVQAVALQYRVGNTGAFTNVAAGFVADATTGPSQATLVTPVSALLPAAAGNQPLVQVRIMTTNAAGNDETVGIDDITVGADVVTPALSISDVTQVEGDSGTSTFAFTVSLSSSANAGGVTFDIMTADGTATVAGNDYVASALTGQTIAAGNSSATFNVTVNGDTTFEPNETFFVVATNVTGATVADGQGQGTITNDDVAVVPTISTTDASAVEGDTGTSTLSFTVTASSAPATDVTFEYATQDGTATTGNGDYVAASGIGTITAGTTSTQVNVTINGDATPEPNETFGLVLSNLSGNAVFTGGAATLNATGTILNDDQGLSIATPAAITEGDSGSAPLAFTVSLTSALGTDLEFTATTANGTATGGTGAPSDYLPLVAQTFTIPAGQASITVPVTVFGDIADESDETFTVAIATTDPRIDATSGPATGTITDNDDAPLEIHAIQGNGLRSPFAPASGNTNGQTVITAANVVTAVGPQGFFIQTPNVRADADPLTSQGLYVFTTTAPPAGIAVGDLVSVKGQVQEFFNHTEITGTLTIVEDGGTGTLPTAIVFDETRPSPNPAALSCSQTLGNFECYENMLVTMPAGVVVAGNQFFGTDPYAEVFVNASGDRNRREEGVRFGLTPPSPTVPVWDGNPEAFELDADRLLPANANRAITGGSLVQATGVIGYDFGNHELWPTQLTIVDAPVPNPVPAAPSTQMTIGSFNVLRLCATMNCSSGAADPTPAEIATKVARLSDYIRTVMRAPDVIGVQEVETLALLQQLATKIATDGGPTYTAQLAEGNDPGGIDVGFLVRADRITTLRVRQLGKEETITDCSGTSPCAKHDRPPYLFQGTYVAGGANFPFAVMNNHIRSRNGLDSGAETARVRGKRFAQGESIANFVQRFQLGQELVPGTPIGDTATANVPLFLVGDYNAFEVTDGWVDVVGLIAGTYDNTKNELQLAGGNITVPALYEGALSIPVENRYSYAFTENMGNIQAQEPRNVQSVQILDHGLVNHVAMPYFKGMAYGRTNVDAPKALTTTGTGGVGVSDHDGLVIYVETGEGIFANGFED